MDTGIIIAIVGSTVAIVGVVISMMFWVRTEANDIRKDQKEDRRDLLQMQKNLEMSCSSMIRGIQLEMQDFHRQMLEIQKSKK